MTELCFCCFIEIAEGQEQSGTATWKVTGMRVISELFICTACRRLQCDVLDPNGCKRPERKRRTRSSCRPKAI